MNESKPKRPTCHICSVPTAGPLPNNGGFFWKCLGCEICWSYDGTRTSGDPRVVARASTRHGRVISLRAHVEAKAKAKGMQRSEVDEWIEALGLRALQDLLG